MAFSAACPEVGVGVHEMSHAELLPGVASGRLTVAIQPGGPAPGFASAELWTDCAVVAMAPDHPLAGEGAIAAEMLAGEVLLVSRDRAREQLHRYLVERLFDGRGVPATRIVADARRSQLLARVADGEGIALLCQSQVDAAMLHLVVKPLADTTAQFRVCAHWREGRPRRELGKLVELLEQSCDR